MKKNILIASGGSGGHIIPATVFYEHLKKNFNTVLSTDTRGLNFINKIKYNLIIINTPKIFNSYLLLPIKIFKIIFLITKSILLLRKYKINSILSTGGYAPLPLCIAGILLKIDLYIYEPNHVLGRSNKFFLKYCKKIFCHTKKIKNFIKKYKKKINKLDPIVRKKFYNKTKKKNNQFNIMIIGGSQSAKIFDKYIMETILKISKVISLKIIHQTNNDNIVNLRNFYNKNKIKNKVFNFNKNLPSLMKFSDYCITRAGASALAELFILRIPFLTIPLSNSKDNHQYYNAKSYVKMNVCWMLKEKDYQKEKVNQILWNTIVNKKNYNNKKLLISKKSKKLNWLKQNRIINSYFNEN